MKLPIVLLLGGGIILLLALVGAQSLIAPPAPNYALMQVQADAARDAAMREANQAAALAPFVTFTAQMFQVLLVVIMAGSVVGAGMLAADWWKAGAVRRRVLVLAAQAQVEAARRPNVPHTYSPHWANQQRIEGGPVPDVPQLAAPMPGLITLSDLLAQGWAPTRDKVLLGLGPGGVRYEVPADDHLCHVLTVGRTGHGKSSFNRLLLPQLIALGLDVYLLDCDYTPLDPKTGEDWASLAARTAPGRAIFEPAEIMATVLDAGAEVERRHLLRRAGLPMGRPRFYAIEEGPAVVAKYPDFMDQAAQVLRRGRRVEIYLMFIAQSALIKIIGGNSGDRQQFGTLAYVGGEPVSARAIFEEKGLPEPGGRGLARLRCFGQSGSVEARIPYGDNAGISQLLARFPAASVAPSRASRPFHIVGNGGDTEGVIEGETARLEVSPEGAERREAVRRLVKAGTSSSEIIKQVWGVSGGRAYATAAQELTAILSQLVA